MNVESIQQELSSLGDARLASFQQGFFKTNEGGYGAGDLFRGIRVPRLRELSRKHRNTSPVEAEQLLGSPYHEDRLLALLILVHRYPRSDERVKNEIYKSYLKNTRFINNWDLVDASAPHIVGRHLHQRSRATLYKLACSGGLWERRIAVMATAHFIKHGDFDDTLKIARMLLDDREDLVHKAVGWMLREIGKRDSAIEEDFLEAHYKRMPRVMLRYAIEKFPPSERRRYLRGEVEAKD